MLQFKNLAKKQSIAFKSPLKKMEELLKLHPAWKGGISILEGQKMLQGQSSFTYMLSEGLDKYHYILHYVGVDNRVHFKNIRILYVNGVPIYKNGACGTYKNIEDLVPSCLQCSTNICVPF